MESKALVKSTNSNVTWRYFARTPSKILWMVNICEVVDLFLRKPFCFFLRMLSILGSMRFRSRALEILAAMDVSVIPRYFLANPRSPFLGKGRMHPFIHLSYFDYRLRCIVGAVCRRIVWSSILLEEGDLVKPCSFPIFNFSKNRVEFFFGGRT